MNDSRLLIREDSDEFLTWTEFSMLINSFVKDYVSGIHDTNLFTYLLRP
jgi:hypothetical protein